MEKLSRTLIKNLEKSELDFSSKISKNEVITFSKLIFESIFLGFLLNFGKYLFAPIITLIASSPSREPTVLDQSGLTTSPLIIRTTQQMGLQVPLGLIVNEMRTSNDQDLVFEAASGTVYLESSSSTTSPESLLETSVVQDILRDGFSNQG